MGLTMDDWQDVLKVIPKFGVEGNEQKINQNIEQFQEKQITPFVTNLMSNLKMGQLPQFKLRVDKNAANTGPQGMNLYVIGRDQLTPNSLGTDPNRVKAQLQRIFKEGGYEAKGSFMGKDMTIRIPKTARNLGGKKMTDPRQLQAMQQQRGMMNRLRRGRRMLNPANIIRDRRARQFIEDKPQSSLVQGQF